MKRKWIQIAAAGIGKEARLYALNDAGEIYFITPMTHWKKSPEVEDTCEMEAAEKLLQGKGGRLMVSEKTIKLLEIEIHLQSIHDSINRAINVLQKKGERKDIKTTLWSYIDTIEQYQKEIRDEVREAE